MVLTIITIWSKFLEYLAHDLFQGNGEKLVVFGAGARVVGQPRTHQIFPSFSLRNLLGMSAAKYTRRFRGG
jgi:hypothetical protein